MAAVVSKIELGEGDAAIVYVTDARSSPQKVTTITVPAAANVPATYGAVAVKASSTNAAAAAAFITWLAGPGRPGDPCQVRVPRPPAEPAPVAASLADRPAASGHTLVAAFLVLVGAVGFLGVPVAASWGGRCSGGSWRPRRAARPSRTPSC